MASVHGSIDLVAPWQLNDDRVWIPESGMQKGCRNLNRTCLNCRLEGIL